jgi:hypothetical protein
MPPNPNPTLPYPALHLLSSPATVERRLLRVPDQGDHHRAARGLQEGHPAAHGYVVRTVHIYITSSIAINTATATVTALLPPSPLFLSNPL